MKYPAKRFKNLHLALKELEPFIRNGTHLQTGRGFKRFGGLRSRELLANWLVCVVANAAMNTDRFTVTSDPLLNGDGIIYDTEAEQPHPTEHVVVPRIRSAVTQDAGTLILEKIAQKQARGAKYASGKTLIVFSLAGAGEWFPNRVARQLPSPLHFAAVWVVTLQGVDELGKYVYAVTHLDLSQGNAPSWRVRIDADFNNWEIWEVKPHQ